jgi:hypothetical protein
VVQRDRVDGGVHAAGPHQRRQRGGEAHPAGAAAEVERLDAQPVAGHDDPAGLPLDHHEGEHPEEALDAGRAPAVVGLEHHLGVGGGEEPVAGLLQLGAQLLVVVDDPVEDHGQAELGVDHRLGAGVGQVDDLQPAVAERHRPGLPATGAVGPPALQLVAHGADRRHVGGPAVEPDLTRDAAHACPSLCRWS